MRNEKIFAQLSACITMIMLISGCDDGWKHDSCQILEHPPVQCTPAPEANSCRWLENMFRPTAAQTRPDRDELRIARNELDTAPSDPNDARRAPDQTDEQASPRNPRRAPKPKLAHGECVDINRADEAELTKLPGIGPGKARQIVQYRDRKPFKKKYDITRIKGIGKKSYRRLESYICEIGA